MIEAIVLFCWVFPVDNLVHKSCIPFRHQMHQSENVSDCRSLLALKIKEVKGDGGRVQMALCVMHRT
jgi:hypothetical protein|tara:strand:+ start:323 stop:523 length:201 start_codon:yes stop_codon:yes gene_type:complete